VEKRQFKQKGADIVENLMSAWDAGFEARMKGDDVEANPFPLRKKQYREWRNGWMDCDEHLRTRDECLRQIGWFG
jgi:hypothetical protein